MVRQAIKRVPVIGEGLRRAYRRWVRPAPEFTDSGTYWDERYRLGGNSGGGSYGRMAEFKAEVLNRFVAEHGIETVLELGCGDGNQLSLADYPHYVGLDVSQQALDRCRERFVADPTKDFALMDDYTGGAAECTMSLDVVYHLVEDDVYTRYMTMLFGLSDRYVVVYSSNTDEQVPGVADHVRQRKFSDWVDEHARDFALIETVPNRYPKDTDSGPGSFADFYIFEKSPVT